MDGAQSEPRVFIIHAGEDKDSIAFPLYNALWQQELAKDDIFLDDVSIHPGEVIRHKIISTLSSKRLELAVIIVTQWLLNKPYWPKLEFETCLKNSKPIFPIWVDDNQDNFNSFSVLVGNYSPTLKQLRARRLQTCDVNCELPNIAVEIVQRLSAAASPLETELDVSLDCSPYISHENIASFLRDYHHLMSGFRRNLLQHTMTLVTDEWRCVMKHAEITVHGTLMRVVFFSGDRTNKFVVHLDGENRPVQSPKNPPSQPSPATGTRGVDQRQDRPPSPKSKPSPSVGITAGVDQRQDRPPSPQSQPTPAVGPAAGVDQRQDRPTSTESQPSPATGKVYVEQQPRPPSPWKKDVNCYPCVSHQDIADFFRNHRERLTDTDRKLLQEAMTLVVPESKWFRDHAQITVYAEHMTVVFYSGKRTNKYVVRLDSGGRPILEVEEKGWRLTARDAVQGGWDWTNVAIRGAFSVAAGSAVGSGLASITSGQYNSLLAIEWK